VIANITRSDLDRLAALHATCFADAWSHDFLGRLLEGPGVQGWLADDDAFLLLRVVADEAEVLSIGTRPDARRAGLARALVRHAIATAQTHGATRLFLEVAADNVAALALYRAHGFAEVGRRSAYYAGGIDALVLARRLSG
jgi:[ribosomal protein S18]-alanine N-acetyltransferase